MGEVTAEHIATAGGVHFASVFNIGQILRLYDEGRKLLTARYHKRWRDTFAIGVATGGLFVGIDVNDDIGLLSVFWRTDSPNTRLRVPDYKPDGSYVYVCWLWNKLDVVGTRALRNHIRRTQVGARRLAHHDHRKKSKQRGRLIDVPLYPKGSVEALAELLAERNGNHGA
jgi:hypothetical protein